MAEINNSDRLQERRFTTLKINLQGDDEDGTACISQTWLNPKLDGGQFKFSPEQRKPWMKPNWMDDIMFRTSTPGAESSVGQTDSDSDSEISYRTKSPPVLSGYPQKHRPKSVSPFGGVLKAAVKFKKGLRSRSPSLSAREDRLTFPGEKPRKRSTHAILAELRSPRRYRRSNTRVTFEVPEEADLHETKRPTRKVSADELDMIVSRLIRPTNASRARTALVRPRFIFDTPKRPEPKRVNYLEFAPMRFRGLRKVHQDEIEEITQRLNTFDIERWPPNSARGERGLERGLRRSKTELVKLKHPKQELQVKQEIGILNGYTWKGIKNSWNFIDLYK